MKFLDTNVIVYSIDDKNADKHAKAKRIVCEAVGNSNYIISAQVLNEFANIAMRKLHKPVPTVKGYLAGLKYVETAAVRPEWTTRALEIKERYELQYYDSLLLAAAESLGCDEFWSEDLNDGQLYCGIKAVNPFK